MNIEFIPGAIEQVQKESDIILGGSTTTQDFPEVFKPFYFSQIEWQRQTPSCGAHAGNYLAEIFETIESGSFTRLSPEYLWKNIKLIDGFPAESGTTMEAIFRVLRQKGVTEASLLPNDTTVDLDTYTSPISLTAEMDTIARKYRIDTYAMQWNPTFDELKRAIYNHKAVILLLRMGDEFWIPSWAEKDILPLKSNRPITSGHFVVAFAYDKEYIYFYNSFGNENATWGKDGIGYFGSDYMFKCVQIGTAVDMKKVLFTAFLKQGSKGSDVSLLQKKLGISVDGIFGPITKKSVLEFQKSNGLVPDGIVGPKTNNVLNNLPNK